MRPTASLLNVLVAGMATMRFHRSEFSDKTLLFPLLLGSVPFAAIGGAIHLSRSIYSPLLGLILLLSAVSLVRSRKIGAQASQDRVTPIPTLPAIAAGSGVGLLAGLTRTGGGFFLSPLLLILGWGFSGGLPSARPPRCRWHAIRRTRWPPWPAISRMSARCPKPCRRRQSRSQLGFVHLVDRRRGAGYRGLTPHVPERVSHGSPAERDCTCPADVRGCLQ